MRTTVGPVLLCLSLAASAAAAVAVPPRPERYATDLAGVIDAGRLSALNERLAQFERDTSNQVLVYVDRRVPADTTLEEFANAAFNAWGVGQKDKSNGVVLFVFVDDRKMRFEVGYGLEGAIPDARTVQIREAFLVPRLRAGDYAGGIEQTADALMAAARGEPFQGTGQTVAESGPSFDGPMPWSVWLMLVAALGAGAAAGRSGTSLSNRFVRGGVAALFAIVIGMMAGTFLTQDARFLAVGFGLILYGFSIALAFAIAQGTSLTGRRRVGLGILQAAAGLVLGSFATFCFAALRPALASVGGRMLLYGILGLVIGGLVQSADPLKILVVFAGRLAFVALAISAIILGLNFALSLGGTQTALDWVAGSGFLWLVLWLFARSRSWPLKVKVDLHSSTYSGGGRSGGWSSSSWSSGSSSSGSSFSGGGGRSGGGGSSGSW